MVSFHIIIQCGRVGWSISTRANERLRTIILRILAVQKQFLGATAVPATFEATGWSSAAETRKNECVALNCMYDKQT